MITSNTLFDDKRYHLTVNPFSLQIEYNFVSTKCNNCQLALFQSTLNLNSIGNTRCNVTHETVLSQIIEDLMGGKTIDLQKGGIAFISKPTELKKTRLS